MRTGLLLSGGMDSIALAWWKRPTWALTIDYGQRAARAEALVSAQVCQVLGIEHEVIAVDCRSLGSGDMAGKPSHDKAGASDWWPYRNQLLLTLASMRAIARDVGVLLIGTVKSDGASHVDGQPEFVDAVDRLIAMQECGLRVQAPAIGHSTAELVRIAGVPPDLLAWAHSCHTSDIACGNCRGCNKHLETLALLGADYSVV